MHFEIYQEKSQGLASASSSGGQWRWRLKADNNRNIANGGEAFHNKQDCVDSIKLVMSTTGLTPLKEVTG